MKGTIDFTTHEEYEEARQQIEALLLENHRTMQRAEFLADEVESKRVQVNDWQESLDKELDNFAEERRQFESQQKEILDLQDRITLVIERVNAANREPIELIDEALLLLELDEDPKEIIKHLRAKREALDVKW